MDVENGVVVENVIGFIAYFVKFYILFRGAILSNKLTKERIALDLLCHGHYQKQRCCCYTNQSVFLRVFLSCCWQNFPRGENFLDNV